MKCKLVRLGHDLAGAPWQRLGAKDFASEGVAVIYAMETVPPELRSGLQIMHDGGRSFMKLSEIERRYVEMKRR